MIALSVAKLIFFGGKRNFSRNKAKIKNVFVEILDQFRRLEVRKKARNVFVMSRYYTTSHLHQVFSILLGFSPSFSLVFRTSKLLEFKEFKKQLFHSRLLDMRLDIANSAFTISYPTRAQGIIVN